MPATTPSTVVLGLDTLTGGAGVDTFAYTAVGRFPRDDGGRDHRLHRRRGWRHPEFRWCDLPGGAGGVYVGAANGYGAVLTSLAAGANNAVLDSTTSILYVDVNG